MADPKGSSPATGLSYDPAADVASRYPDWVIGLAVLGWGIQEVLCRRSKVILLEVGDTRAGRRSSLAHAVAHLDLGHHAVSSGFFDARQERAANQLAAGRLVPIESLTQALVWTRDPSELASELMVDRDMLALRLRSLTPDEVSFLRRQVAWLAEAA